MTRYFTHYWSKQGVYAQQHPDVVNKPLDHIAGNLFRKRNISSGDVVYIVTVTKGELYVLSRLVVAKICNVREAAADLGVDPIELWEANEHILPTEPHLIYFDRVLPVEVTECLRFLTERGKKLLTFVTPGCLERQTLRGVRELEPESAVKSDKFLY